MCNQLSLVSRRQCCDLVTDWCLIASCSVGIRDDEEIGSNVYEFVSLNTASSQTIHFLFGSLGCSSNSGTSQCFQSTAESLSVFSVSEKGVVNTLKGMNDYTGKYFSLQVSATYDYIAVATPVVTVSSADNFCSAAAMYLKSFEISRQHKISTSVDQRIHRCSVK